MDCGRRFWRELRKVESTKESFCLLRECEESGTERRLVEMWMVKPPSEACGGSGKHVIGQWREGKPGYKVAKQTNKQNPKKNMAKLGLHSSVLWKIEFVSMKSII